MTTPTIERPGTGGPNAGLLEWLAAHDVDYELHEHPLAMTALETAAADGVDPRRFAKTLVAEKDTGARALLVLDALDRLDLRKGATALGTTHIHLISEAELAEIAPDIEVGALPPIGDLVGLPVLADPAIRDDPTITFPAGSHRFSVVVDREAWGRAVRVSYVDLVVPVDRGPIWAR
jgi:Ala-tRNA(Pro) deacylase